MPAITVGLPAALTSPQPARDVACEASTVGEALRAVVEQAPQYEQRIFYGDRLLVVVTLNGKHLPPADRQGDRAGRRRPRRGPAAGRRRLTPSAEPRARRRMPSPWRASPPGVARRPAGYRPSVDRGGQRRETVGDARDAQRVDAGRAARPDGRHLPRRLVGQPHQGVLLAERLGGLRAAVRRHHQGRPLRRPAELGDDPQRDRVRLRAVRHRVRRLRAVPGARPLHARVGAARRRLPAEPAGRDVGHRRVAGHLHHHVPAAGRRSASRSRAGRSGLDALLARRDPHPRLPVY